MLVKTVGIAVVAAALSSAATYMVLDKRLAPIETRMAHTPPIAVLDTKNFANRLVDRPDGEPMSLPLQMMGQSMEKMRAEGYLVLNRDAVAASWLPPGLDLIKEVLGEPVPQPLPLFGGDDNSKH